MENYFVIGSDNLLGRSLVKDLVLYTPQQSKILTMGLGYLEIYHRDIPTEDMLKVSYFDFKVDENFEYEVINHLENFSYRTIKTLFITLPTENLETIKKIKILLEVLKQIKQNKTINIKSIILTSTTDVITINSDYEYVVDENFEQKEKELSTRSKLLLELENVILSINGEECKTAVIRCPILYGENQEELKSFYNEEKIFFNKENINSRCYVGNASFMHLKLSCELIHRNNFACGKKYYCYDDTPLLSYEKFLKNLIPCNKKQNDSIFKKIVTRICNTKKNKCDVSNIIIKTKKAEKTFLYKPKYSWEESKNIVMNWVTNDRVKKCNKRKFEDLTVEVKSSKKNKKNSFLKERLNFKDKCTSCKEDLIKLDSEIINSLDNCLFKKYKDSNMIDVDIKLTKPTLFIATINTNKLCLCENHQTIDENEYFILTGFKKNGEEVSILKLCKNNLYNISWFLIMVPTNVFKIISNSANIKIQVAETDILKDYFTSKLQWVSKDDKIKLMLRDKNCFICGNEVKRKIKISEKNLNSELEEKLNGINLLNLSKRFTLQSEGFAKVILKSVNHGLCMTCCKIPDDSLSGFIIRFDYRFFEELSFLKNGNFEKKVIIDSNIVEIKTHNATDKVMYFKIPVDVSYLKLESLKDKKFINPYEDESDDAKLYNQKSEINVNLVNNNELEDCKLVDSILKNFIVNFD